MADSPGTWPVFDEGTADFRYARLHGADELYASGYTPSAWTLGETGARVAGRRRRASSTSTTTPKVHAPYDALALAERLS
jgi:uncharacterized protein YecE (DUF72 family)